MPDVSINTAPPSDSAIANQAASVAAQAAAAAVTATADATAKISQAVALLSNDMGYMRADVIEIKTLLNTRYVTKDEHDSVLKDIALLQKIVFSGIGIVVVGVITYVLTTVVFKR